MPEADLLGWLPAWTKVALDMRVTTLVIALATGVSVWITNRMGRATRESAEAAKRSAESAEIALQVTAEAVAVSKESVAVSRKALEFANRPYLVLRTAYILNVETERQIQLLFRLLGNIPVWITTVQLRITSPAEVNLVPQDAPLVVVPSGLDHALFCKVPRLCGNALNEAAEIAAKIVVHYHGVGFDSVFRYEAAVKMTSSDCHITDLEMA